MWRDVLPMIQLVLNHLMMSETIVERERFQSLARISAVTAQLRCRNLDLDFWK